MGALVRERNLLRGRRARLPRAWSIPLHPGALFPGGLRGCAQGEHQLLGVAGTGTERGVSPQAAAWAIAGGNGCGGCGALSLCRPPPARARTRVGLILRVYLPTNPRLPQLFIAGAV